MHFATMDSHPGGWHEGLVAIITPKLGGLLFVVNFKLAEQNYFTYLNGFSPVWVRTWLARVSLFESHLWQMEHCTLFFSLLWTRSRCLVRLCTTGKLFPHISQVYDLFRWSRFVCRVSLFGVLGIKELIHKKQYPISVQRGGTRSDTRHLQLSFF